MNFLLVFCNGGKEQEDYDQKFVLNLVASLDPYPIFDTQDLDDSDPKNQAKNDVNKINSINQANYPLSKTLALTVGFDKPNFSDRNNINSLIEAFCVFTIVTNLGTSEKRKFAFNCELGILTGEQSVFLPQTIGGLEENSENEKGFGLYFQRSIENIYQIAKFKYLEFFYPQKNPRDLRGFHKGFLPLVLPNLLSKTYLDEEQVQTTYCVFDPRVSFLNGSLFGGFAVQSVKGSYSTTKTTNIDLLKNFLKSLFVSANFLNKDSEENKQKKFEENNLEVLGINLFLNFVNSKFVNSGRIFQVPFYFIVEGNLQEALKKDNQWYNNVSVQVQFLMIENESQKENRIKFDKNKTFLDDISVVLVFEIKPNFEASVGMNIDFLATVKFYFVLTRNQKGQVEIKLFVSGITKWDIADNMINPAVRLVEEEGASKKIEEIKGERREYELDIL